MGQLRRKRDWRDARSSTHTTREIRGEIPSGLAEVIAEMTNQINALQFKVHDLESRLNPVEAGIKSIAAEAAKRAA